MSWVCVECPLKRKEHRQKSLSKPIKYMYIFIDIYKNVYVSTHTQPPSWGVMFENPLPPPKKKGEDNLHRQNTTLKC